MNEINVIPTDEKLKVQTYVCTAVSFELGSVVMTQGVASMVEENKGVNLFIYLQRHQSGDWGNVCIEEKITNGEATKTGRTCFI